MAMLGLQWLMGRGNSGDGGKREILSQAKEQRNTSGFRATQTATVLLQTAERQRLIRVIQENCPLSQQVMEAWWLKPLEQLAVRVQDIPADWSGPFSAPGGFIDLSLKVATHAVRLARGMMLPPGATPEEQSEQAAGWTCAVHWAALFHHLDWLSGIEGETQSGKAWYPGLSIPAEIWRIRPRTGQQPTRYTGMYLANRLLPDAGVLWLQRWPALSDSLLSYLCGQRVDSGILNSIITDARASCGLTETCSTGPAIPTVSQTIEHKFNNNDINNNSPKLSDTEPNQSSINSSDTGVINAIVPGLSRYAEKEVEPLIQVGSFELASAFDSNDESFVQQKNTAPESHSPVSAGELLSLLDQMSGSQSSRELTQNGEHAIAAQSPVVLAPTAETDCDEESSPGTLFLAWLKQSVIDGSLTVNQSDSILHVLARFVFLVSPDCFYKYISSVNDAIQDKVLLQKSFEALHIHYSQNGKGLYHYHKYDTPDKTGRYTKTSGYMMVSDVIFKTGVCPSDSELLAPRR